MTIARRLRFHHGGPGPRVEVETFEAPAPSGRQILVRVTHSAVSAGSEMNFVRFGPQAYGIVPKDGDDGYNIGYMTVGTVAALGPEASGYSVGQRVLTGGYHSSHWLVDPATPSGHILPIPEGVSDDAAGFAMLGDVALHGVRRAALQIDGSVAVFGMGMVGQLTLQLARLSGSHPLIAVDLDDARLEMAKASGATHVINAGREDAVARIKAITDGKGAETIFHCTQVAGILQQLLEACGNRGRIVLTGSPPGTATIRLQEDLLRRETTLTGIYESGMAEGHPYWPWTRERNRRASLRLMADGGLRMGHLLTHVVPYTQAQAMFEMMARGSTGWLGVVFDWTQA
jgi:threonine dehydrogenase-like Zn-dependent dehydrogenase